MLIVDLVLGKILSDVGFVGFFILWVLYQVYSPGFMPDTKFQRVKNDIQADIAETKHMLLSAITVLRAVVRTNEEIDTEEVDAYLTENGVEPDHFIRQRGGGHNDPPGDG